MKLLISASILTIALVAFVNVAHSEEWSMGDGGHTGQVYQLYEYSNHAMDFETKARSWREKWNPETVGRKDLSEIKAQGATYCLSPKVTGVARDIYMQGKQTANHFSSYLQSHPEDQHVRAAAENHERNLKGFYDHILTTDAPAKCRS